MNKRRDISIALIILLVLLFAPANVLALSDLDTKFWVQLHGHLKRTVPCDFLTISNGKLSCRGILFEEIPLSRIKRLDVVYMGKEYNVSEINESDIKNVNAMSMKKEEAFAGQAGRDVLTANTEGIDFSHGLPSEQAFKYIEQRRAAQQAYRQKVSEYPYKTTERSRQANKAINTGAFLSVMIAFLLEHFVGLLFYFPITWHFMRKNKGEELSIGNSWFIGGLLAATIGAGAIRFMAIFIIGGKAVINPEGKLGVFFFLVLPVLTSIIVCSFLKRKALLKVKEDRKEQPKADKTTYTWEHGGIFSCRKCGYKAGVLNLDNGLCKTCIQEEAQQNAEGSSHSNREESHDNQTHEKRSKTSNIEKNRVFACPTCKQRIRVTLPLSNGIGLCVTCGGKFRAYVDQDGNLYIELVTDNSQDDGIDDIKSIDDCFALLEIPVGANVNDIKCAYRKKIKEYHPDKASSLGSKLKTLAEQETKKLNYALALLKENGFV